MTITVENGNNPTGEVIQVKPPYFVGQSPYPIPPPGKAAIPMYPYPAYPPYAQPVFRPPYILPNGAKASPPAVPIIPAPTSPPTISTISPTNGKNTIVDPKVVGTSSSTQPKLVQPQQYSNYNYYYYPQMQQTPTGKPGIYPYMYQPPLQQPNTTFSTISPTANINAKTPLIKNKQSISKQPAPEAIISPPTANGSIPTFNTLSTPQRVPYPPTDPKRNSQFKPVPFPQYFMPPNAANGPKFNPYPPVYGRGMPIVPQIMPNSQQQKLGPNKNQQGTIFKVPPTGTISNIVPKGVVPMQNNNANRGRGKLRGKQVPTTQQPLAPLLIRNVMPHMPMSPPQVMPMMNPYGMVGTQQNIPTISYPVFPNVRSQPLQHLSTLVKMEKKISNQDMPIIIEEEESPVKTMIEIKEEEKQVFEPINNKMEIEEHVDDFENQHVDNVLLERLFEEQRVKYPITFKSMLLGKTDYEYYKPVISVFSGRKLPFVIRRDNETEPLKKQLLKEIMGHHYGHDKYQRYYQVGSIDYCHLQEWHLPQVNTLLSKAFWPDIDSMFFN